MTKKTPGQKAKTTGAKTEQKTAEKTIVLTLYGKGETVTELSINLFAESTAKKYCQNTNALALKAGKWIHAAIVEESGKIIIKKPPTAEKDIGMLLRLHDIDIQKMMRKLDALTLMYALKNAPKAVQDKIFRNMVPRAAKILKEDLDYTGKVPLSKVRAAQNQIAAIVDTLALNGEIEIIDEKFV